MPRALDVAGENLAELEKHRAESLAESNGNRSGKRKLSQSRLKAGCVNVQV